MKKTILKNRTGLQAFAPAKSLFPLLGSSIIDYSLAIFDLPFPVVVFPFDLSDVAKSSKINNTASFIEYERMFDVARHFYFVLEKLYSKNELSDADISTLRVTSQYRCSQLNRVVGGSPTSLHRYGLAFDLVGSEKALNAVYSGYSEYFNTIIPIRRNSILYPKELIKYYKMSEYKPCQLHIGFGYTLPRLEENSVLPF